MSGSKDSLTIQQNIMAAEEEDFDKSLRNTLKWWNYVRWFSTISFFSLGIIQISISGFSFPPFAFILTLLAITLLNIAYSIWINHFKNQSIFPIIHNLLDIVIFSLAIFMTGGIKSPFLWGYLIPILTSSITIGIRAGFFASMLSVIGLIGVSQLGGLPLVNSLKQTYAIFNFTQFDTKTLLSFGCLFFLVYFISSFLANTLRTQNQHLKSLNQQLQKKNKLILESQEKLIEMQKRDTIYQTALTLQHEINNPMTILSLNTELLAKDTPDKDKQRIQKITDAVQRIKTILDKIKVLHSKTIQTRDALNGLKIIDLENTDVSRTNEKHQSATEYIQ